MKPMPSAPGPDDSRLADAPSALPLAPSTASGTYSNANRRSQPACNVHRVYPLLLCASTVTAAAFCFLYINKPVISEYQSPPKPETPVAQQTATHPQVESLLPNKNHLPGQQETDEPATENPKQTTTIAPLHSIYEETNLRMQHILTAEAPGGQVSRIDLNVPVLYPSRQMRWSTEELAQARTLMLQLMDYQDKSRQLRSEGEKLLESWSRLIEQSIPASELRADSPSLPSNQENAGREVRTADTTSSNAIQIQAADP